MAGAFSLFLGMWVLVRLVQSARDRTQKSRRQIISIRSRSELKERRLISDSRYPGGFAARLLFSPLLSISICVVKYDGIMSGL